MRRSSMLPMPLLSEPWQFAQEWTVRVLTHDWWHKLWLSALFALTAEVEVLWGPLLVAWVAFLVDWLLGASRALVDPDVPFDRGKAARAWVKPVVILAAAVLARTLEWTAVLALGYDPSGKLVLAVCVGIVYEDAESAVSNFRYWYRQGSLEKVLRRAAGLLGRPETEEDTDGDA